MVTPKSSTKTSTRSSVRSSKTVAAASAAPKVVASFLDVSSNSNEIADVANLNKDKVVRQSELAERVAARTDIKKSDAKAASLAAIDVVIEALHNGESFVLPNVKIGAQRAKHLEKGSMIIAKFRVKAECSDDADAADDE